MFFIWIFSFSTGLLQNIMIISLYHLNWCGLAKCIHLVKPVRTQFKVLFKVEFAILTSYVKENVWILVRSGTQPAFICSKLTIETLEEDVKYV